MTPHPWLSRFAWLTAVATWVLVGLGGLVTSKGVGMAVPDWPTSYGYNMFALPFSMWLTGGVFEEHTHRQWASMVGILVVILTRWLGGSRSRVPLITIGFGELVAGFGLLAIGPDWKGAGYFLSGIGGVVLLAGLVWVRSKPLPSPLPALGWTAFALVQVQGLLGGLRVVLDSHILADIRLGTAFGVLHGCLGQIFLVLLCVIAVFTSRWWQDSVRHFRVDLVARWKQASGTLAEMARLGGARRWIFGVTCLIFLQLMLGAAMRHQHSGLAVPDFPLAYGQIYPATDASSIDEYNAERIDPRQFNRITAGQIHLHMMHRFNGILLLFLVPFAAWRFWSSERGLPGAGLAKGWACLIFLQAILGILTVLMNKPADIATAHVLTGALCLVIGVVLFLAAREFSIATVKPVMQSPAHSLAHPAPQTLT